MKKALIGIFCIFAFAEGMIVLAVNQPHSLGYVTFGTSSGTIVEINTSSPTMVGNPRWCTNCVANGGVGTVCYSTKTASCNAFVLSTGTKCQ